MGRLKYWVTIFLLSISSTVVASVSTSSSALISEETAESKRACPDQGWDEVSKQLSEFKDSDSEKAHVYLKQPNLADCNRASAYVWLATAASNDGKSENALAIIKQAEREIADPLDRLDLLMAKARAYQLIAKYGAEQQQYLQILKYDLPESLDNYHTEALLGMAHSHSLAGNNLKALKWTEQALEKRHTVTDKKIEMSILVFSSSVYYYQQWYEQSVKLLRQAIKLAEAIDENPITFSSLYDNIAAVELRRGNYQESLEYLQKEYDICVEHDWLYCLFFVHQRSAENYRELGRFDQAQTEIEKANNYLHLVKEPRLLVNYWRDVAWLNAAQGNKDAAKVALENLTDLWHSNDAKSDSNRAEYQYARGKIAQLLGDEDKAMQWFEQRGDTLSELMHHQSQRMLANMFAELEMFKHERRTEELQAENENKVLRLDAADKQRNLQRQMLIFQALGLAALLSLLVFFWHNRRKWRRVAQMDFLTQVMNRGELVAQSKRLSQSEKKFGIILFDLDLFKKVNDQYGHPAGDVVLKTVSHRIKNCVKHNDVIGRMGGEEFMILLRTDSEILLAAVADRLRRVVFNDGIVIGEDSLKVSISIGTTMMHCDDEEFSAAYSRADKALYLAKQNGRNRVETIAK